MLERVMPTIAGMMHAAQTAGSVACKVTQVAVKVADVVATGALIHLVGKQAYPGKCPLAERVGMNDMSDSVSPAVFALQAYGCARLAMYVFSNMFGKTEASKTVTSSKAASVTTLVDAPAGRTRSRKPANA